MSIKERFWKRRNPEISPQELLDAVFMCFQVGRERVGRFVSSHWRFSIEENREGGDPRLVIRKSSNSAFQNTGELAVIAPSPGSLSHFRIVNGKIVEACINSRSAIKRIRNLLNQVAVA